MHLNDPMMILNGSFVSPHSGPLARWQRVAGGWANDLRRWWTERQTDRPTDRQTDRPGNCSCYFTYFTCYVSACLGFRQLEHGPPGWPVTQAGCGRRLGAFITWPSCADPAGRGTCVPGRILQRTLTRSATKMHQKLNSKNSVFVTTLSAMPASGRAGPVIY